MTISIDIIIWKCTGPLKHITLLLTIIRVSLSETHTIGTTTKSPLPMFLDHGLLPAFHKEYRRPGMGEHVRDVSPGTELECLLYVNLILPV